MDMLSFQLTNPRSVPLVTLVANCNFGTISVAEKNLLVGWWQVNGNTRDSADRPDPTEINQRSASVPQRLSLVAYFDMKSSALCLD